MLRREKRVFITRENRVRRRRLWPGGGAILTFTRHLAQERGPYGINVNAVAPGVVLSGPRLQKMWDERMSQEQKQQYQDRVPLRRLATVEEITGPPHLKASSYPPSVSSP